MINWDQVKQLEEDIGAEDFGDVVVMFIEEVDEAVDNLRAEPQLSDDDLASAMHFLKGSAANLGFKDFADYCSDGEKMAQTGNSTQVDLTKVITLYDQSKSMFLGEVSNHTEFIPE
jgi:HPt (histidine-containing phosphotransfer) domain-containing protein